MALFSVPKPNSQAKSTGFGGTLTLTPVATKTAAPTNTVSLANISAADMGPPAPANLSAAPTTVPISNVGATSVTPVTSLNLNKSSPATVTTSAPSAGASSSASKTLAIPSANPNYFPKVNESGLPILDKSALDSVLGKSNKLTANQYRDNYNKFGWNVKSDSSGVLRGAAAFGVNANTSPMGGIINYTGDFNKAAQQLGIDISGLKTPKQKFDAINNAAKDYYIVSNALDRTGTSSNEKAPHATILFKAQGNDLVPVTDASGNPSVKYYNAVGVTHEGWQGQLAELAPLLAVAGAAYAMPQIMSAISAAGPSASTLAAATGAVESAVSGTSLAGGLTGGLALPAGATIPGVASLSAGGGVLAPSLGASLGAGGTAIGAGSVGLSPIFASGLTAGAANLLPTMVNAADLLAPTLGTGLGASGIKLSDLTNVPTSVPNVGGGNEDITDLPSDNQIPSTDELPSGDLGLPPFDEGGLPPIGGITGGTNAVVDQIQKATGLSAADAKNLLSSAIDKSSLASILGSAGQGAASIYAADKQYQAAKYAADLQKQMFDIINSQYAPQRGAGYQALGQIRSMLPGQYTKYDETGKPIGTATGADYLTRQFTPQDLYAGLAPNYNFMLQQGQQAAQRQGNVSGGGLGGNVQRALQEYTQNYAGNAYQNAFQNFQNQRSNIYNTLAGIAGIGQTAQNTTSQAGQNMATNVGQLAVGGAGAQAAGITGAANAIAGGAQNYGANQILQAILNQNQNVAQGGSTATPPFNPA